MCQYKGEIKRVLDHHMCWEGVSLPEKGSLRTGKQLTKTGWKRIYRKEYKYGMSVFRPGRTAFFSFLGHKAPWLASHLSALQTSQGCCDGAKALLGELFLDYISQNPWPTWPLTGYSGGCSPRSNFFPISRETVWIQAFFKKLFYKTTVVKMLQNNWYRIGTLSQNG